MSKLSHTDLFSLEEYSRIRPDFRAKVIDHKKNRRVVIGEHAALYFEDALTMQYQIQEMLRIEKIFEADGIQDELDVYNPLIPDGQNWKATFMVEFSDVEERKVALAQFIGIEQALWIQVDGYDRVHAIANEDLDRTTDEKTSAVHFVRFELTSEMVSAAKKGAAITAGITHPEYDEKTVLSQAVRESLVGDLH